MKNKNITRNILNEYGVIAETPNDNLWEKIENGINSVDIKQQTKKTRKYLMKPVLAAAMCLMLITTAVAAAPFIFKMLGSNIGFFETDKETRYSPYQEKLKKYSVEVNITQEQDGISFTIDNIAVDDNFINIFYTIKSEYNIYEYIQNWYVKRDGGQIIESRWYNNPKYHDFALSEFTPVLDYRLPDIENGNSGNRNNFDSLDNYAVSDYEIKGAQKMLISEELPDIFNIEIFINDYDFYENLSFVNINLTIDRTETSIKTSNIYPNVSAVLTGKMLNKDEIITHDITVEKISMSPLGNVIVFSEKAENTELFWDYVLMDDKGNYLERNFNGMRFRAWESADKETVRFADEIYGIDEDTEYLRLIPFTKNSDFTWIDGVTKVETGEYYSDIRDAYADKHNLPAKLRHTNKSVVNIESIETLNDTVTVTYSVEGVAGYTNMNFLFNLVLYDNVNSDRFPVQMFRNFYDAETKKYTTTITLPGFESDISEVVKGVGISSYFEITLLEDEAIIIPLK